MFRSSASMFAKTVGRKATKNSDEQITAVIKAIIAEEGLSTSGRNGERKKAKRLAGTLKKAKAAKGPRCLLSQQSSAEMKRLEKAAIKEILSHYPHRKDIKQRPSGPLKRLPPTTELKRLAEALRAMDARKRTEEVEAKAEESPSIAQVSPATSDTATTALSTHVVAPPPMLCTAKDLINYWAMQRENIAKVIPQPDSTATCYTENERGEDPFSVQHTATYADQSDETPFVVFNSNYWLSAAATTPVSAIPTAVEPESPASHVANYERGAERRLAPHTPTLCIGDAL